MKKILLLLLGVALPFVMESAPPKKPAAKQDGRSLLSAARQAYYDYDFDRADDYYSQFRKLPESSRRAYEAEFSELADQLEIALNAFDRVQQIVVVDSVHVPVGAFAFAKSYRLSESSGRILTGDEMTFLPLDSESAVGHLSEDGDYIIWSQVDENGNQDMKEAYRWLDGNWEVMDIEIGSPESVTNYGLPFMSGDGQTVYFSAEGPGSMGGLDIFIAQRDPITGEFLQPLNLGMPFNSPYNDFMMAVDEENGIGWWATDRDSEPGMATVYIYLLNDVRKNYPEDTPDLEKLAKLTDYKATQPEEAKEQIESLKTRLRHWQR